MTNVKMTKAQKFSAIMNALEVAEISFEGFNVSEFLASEIEMIEKRNASKSANRKPSKTQVENETIVLGIVEMLEENTGEMFTAKEIAERVMPEASSQKMTALMKKAVEGYGVVKGKKGKLVAYGYEAE